MHVLIVEDNEGDQVLLREAFSQTVCKAEVSFAGTVAEALAILKKKIFNLILLDLNLPGKNGKDFLKEFGTDNNYRRIPIIILTSSSMEKDIAECYALGASGYLIKPSNFNELEEMAVALCQFWEKVTYAKVSPDNSFRPQ